MRFKIWIALCLIGRSTCVVQNRFNEKLLENDEFLGKCLQKIITHIDLPEFKRDATVVNSKTAALSGLLLKINGLRYVTRSFFWPNNTLGNSMYIIYCDNYIELKNGINSLKRDFHWNPKANFIIVIRDLKDRLNALSSYLMEQYIFNVTVLKKEKQDYELFTFNSKLDACGTPAIKTLISATLCSKLNSINNLFNVEIPKSFKGCHIKLAGQEYWPWLSFEKTRQRVGVSIKAVQIWREWAGVDVEVVEYDKGGNLGRVLDNFTATGMLKWIEEGKVEGALGGYVLTYDRAKLLDFTYPYSIDRALIIVAKAGFLTNWRAVSLQFTWYSMIIIFMFVLFFCYAVIRFSIFSENKEDVVRGILIVFGYLCGNMRYKYIKTHSSLRLVVCCLLLFVFFLSFLIQAYLLSATANPMRGHQIKHLSEALTKCKPLKSWVWQTVFHPKDVPNFDCDSILDCLIKVKDRNKKLYNVIPELTYLSEAWKVVDESGELQIYPILEPANNMYRVIYFRRGIPVAKSYSRLLSIFQESLILRQHLNNLIYEERLKFMQSRDAGRSPETLNDFLEVFYVLWIGYILSFIVFIYECRSVIAYYCRFSLIKY